MGLDDEIGLDPLPDLEFEPQLRPNANLGEVGELRWLPIGQLYIDRRYQRHILRVGKQNIRKMVEEFAWSKFGALVVGKRAPTVYAIVDGQHRATAAHLRGDIAKLPCLVREGGQREEAEAFAALHTLVTRIHPLQAFRAAVVGGDSYSIETVNLCMSADVTIVAYPKVDMKAGETQSLGNLRTLMRNHSARFVKAVLRLLRVLDPQAGLSNMAIMGTARMLERHDEWIDRAEEIGAKIGAAHSGGLSQLERDAKQRKLSYGSTEVLNFAHLIEQAAVTATRVGSRFMDPAMARRAMAGR